MKPTSRPLLPGFWRSKQQRQLTGSAILQVGMAGFFLQKHSAFVARGPAARGIRKYIKHQPEVRQAAAVNWVRAPLAPICCPSRGRFAVCRLVQQAKGTGIELFFRNHRDLFDKRHVGKGTLEIIAAEVEHHEAFLKANLITRLQVDQVRGKPKTLAIPDDFKIVTFKKVGASYSFSGL